MPNNSTDPHNTSGNDPANPTSATVSFVTVPLSEARDGDHFRGIIQRGGVIIAAAGPIQIRMSRPYLSGMVPLLDNEVWEDVTVTREVPIGKTRAEVVAELPAGTAFYSLPRVEGGKDYRTLYIRNEQGVLGIVGGHVGLFSPDDFGGAPAREGWPYILTPGLSYI